MKPQAVCNMTTVELVERFVEVTIAQDEAEHRGQFVKYRRLYDLMMDVVNELKSRDGDQRRALMALYRHRNLHVWAQAAHFTLAVAPEEARTQFEVLAASDRLPYSADAGMTLWNLDRGVYKPT